MIWYDLLGFGLLGSRSLGTSMFLLSAGRILVAPQRPHKASSQEFQLCSWHVQRQPLIADIHRLIIDKYWQGMYSLMLELYAIWALQTCRNVLILLIDPGNFHGYPMAGGWGKETIRLSTSNLDKPVIHDEIAKCGDRQTETNRDREREREKRLSGSVRIPAKFVPSLFCFEYQSHQSP